MSAAHKRNTVILIGAGAAGLMAAKGLAGLFRHKIPIDGSYLVVQTTYPGWVSPPLVPRDASQRTAAGALMQEV